MARIYLMLRNGSGNIRIFYGNKDILGVYSENKKPLYLRHEKLYFGVVINECNRYSSLKVLYKTDAALVNDDYEIVEISKGMHPNTYIENEKATRAILLPLNYFDIEVGKKFEIME